MDAYKLCECCGNERARFRPLGYNADGSPRYRSRCTKCQNKRDHELRKIREGRNTGDQKRRRPYNPLPFMVLAEKIITQALEDWRGPERYGKYDDLVIFFSSEWFTTLLSCFDIDPETVRQANRIPEPTPEQLRRFTEQTETLPLWDGVE